jgi:hypothetical protein
MAGRPRIAARGVLAPLLASVLMACSLVEMAGDATVGPDVAEPTSSARGPTVVDSNGARLEPEYAEVVREVHQALVDGDLERLRSLYHGDDWAGQADLLSQQRVRDEVLTVLRTHPANLGEGYIYPGFSVTGWTGPRDRADGAVLGVTPAELPDPTTGYSGYQTAFFLEYNPPHDADGPLQWRGIAKLPAMSG